MYRALLEKAKRDLYLKLTMMRPSDLTASDADLMWQLSNDEDIQLFLEKAKNIHGK